MVGKRVGDWKVIKFVGLRGGMRFWRCRCKCGYEKDFSTSYLNTGLPSRCPDCRKSLRGANEKELVALCVGKTFGKYTVVKMVGRNKYGSREWLCQCACGRERVFLTSYLSGNGKRKATQCPACVLKEMEQKNRTVTEVPDRFWRRFLDHAKRRNLPVSVSKEDANSIFQRQGHHCALSGEPLHFTNLRTNYNRYTTASLDRIDSSRPYEAGNLQWVHKMVNVMKWSMSQEEFLGWCRKITQSHPLVEVAQ